MSEHTTQRCPRDSDWCDGMICANVGFSGCPNSDAAREEASLRRLNQAHAAFLDAVQARARAERAEADLRVVYEAERRRHHAVYGEDE